MRPAHVRLLFGAALLPGCGGEPVAPAPDPTPPPVMVSTTNFMIVDRSEAPAALLDSLGARLELERQRVADFFPEFVPPGRILFNLRPDDGIPFVGIGDNSMNQWRETLAFDYIPHQLTHLWTRYTRRPFLEEGIAVYVTEVLLPDARNVNPHRGQSPHAWMTLFNDNGTALSLFSAYRADNFSFAFTGSTGDAFAWQVFVQAGSFTRYVIETFGRDAWLQLLQLENLEDALGATTVDLERGWHESARLGYPDPLACEDAIQMLGAREVFWCARAAGS